MEVSTQFQASMDKTQSRDYSLLLMVSSKAELIDLCTELRTKLDGQNIQTLLIFLLLLFHQSHLLPFTLVAKMTPLLLDSKNQMIMEAHLLLDMNLKLMMELATSQ